jgi:nucleotide-binding universal stress UspA family protein
MAQLFRRILVPHDMSEQATSALKVAVELAAESKGKVFVLHALPPFQPVGGGMAVGEIPIWFPPDELVAQEREQLQGLVAHEVGKSGVAYECAVEVGDPYTEIIAAAHKADVIVMATTGRTGLAHLVIGSVAEKVVRHSPIPVLTIRPSPARSTSDKPAHRSGSRRRTEAERAASS